MNKHKQELLAHPKPNEYRPNWKSLNGTWDFLFDPQNEGLQKKYWKDTSVFNKKILVPFVYQSEKSGINCKDDIPIVWYKKKFSVDIKLLKTYLLHFQAVDYKTDVWLNEEYIGSNEGGFFDFKFDVGAIIEQENTIVIRVEDYTKTTHNLGKQTYKDETFLCWYTRTTGIWQDVWIEEVGYNYIDDLKMTPNLQTASIDIDLKIKKAGDYEVKTTILYDGRVLCEEKAKSTDENFRSSHYLSSRHADFRLFYWSPEKPNLYDVKFEVIRDGEIVDELISYFGMRQIGKREGYITINNEKIFHKMVLDQGYFGKGLMTPSSPEDLLNDVKKMLEIGFNGVRKHQKIEDSRFMYLCDVYGLIMWAELPSFYEYSFESVTEMTKTISKFVQKHYNHPSVCTYVLFNESWGLNRIYNSQSVQNFVDGSYYLTKALDQTRLVIGNDGWEHTKTDVLTIHDYNENDLQIEKIYANKNNIVNGSPSQTSNKYNYVPGYEYDGCPIFISEYGGVAFETELSKEFNTWGYGKRINDPQEVLSKVNKITNSFAKNEYITGVCYTQLTDVEQEINGILDHNHEYKFPVEEIREALITNREGGFIFE